ncbi:hypothetical protein BDZ97DRAFT_1636848, partial [Flammula alnicola]
MPPKDSKRAPKYKGNVKTLNDFFEEFEEHADAAGLTNEEKATWVVRYVKSKEVALFWKSMTAYTTSPKSYSALKQAILDQYPGAKKGENYTNKSLVKLTAETASKSMKTENRLVKYYEKFRPMAMWLKNKNVIT